LLYDLTADPLELRPRSASSIEELDGVGALRAAIDAATEAHPVADLIEPARAASPASAEELARIEQQMKLLGYM
jgi:hypothetical protein